MNFIIKFQNYVHFNSGMSATCVITVCVCVCVCVCVQLKISKGTSSTAVDLPAEVLIRGMGLHVYV